MCSTRATHTKVNENTVMGAINSMVSIEVQGRWEGDLYGPLRGGRKAPLGRVLKEGGIPPHPPSFSRGRTGWMGRHVTQRIRGGTGSDSGCLQLVFVQRWRTLPVVPDDLPVLSDEVYEIIARMYRLATAKDRALDGWYRIHGEMRYLPRCPKRKRIISLKGFSVPRHGNLLRPVTGYFFRRMMRTVFG